MTLLQSTVEKLETGFHLMLLPKCQQTIMAILIMHIRL